MSTLETALNRLTDCPLYWQLPTFARQKMRPYLVRPNQQDLLALKDLAESGKPRPVIDRTYPLGEPRPSRISKADT